MEHAVYGRMSDSGRCLNVDQRMTALKQDPRYLGCSKDVLGVMDRKCSGRTHCRVRIIDPELLQNTPCYNDLSMYLEASYRCVSGENFRYFIGFAAKTTAYLKTETAQFRIEQPRSSFMVVKCNLTVFHQLFNEGVKCNAVSVIGRVNYVVYLYPTCLLLLHFQTGKQRNFRSILGKFFVLERLSA
jgi:hypothetical protein